MGEKRSSHAIAEEYAKADPIYVAKTAVSERGEEEDECTNCTAGAASEILALPPDPRRWELWMAGYVQHHELSD